MPIDVTTFDDARAGLKRWILPDGSQATAPAEHDMAAAFRRMAVSTGLPPEAFEVVTYPDTGTTIVRPKGGEFPPPR